MNPALCDPCFMNPALCDPCFINPMMCDPCFITPWICDPCFMNPALCNPCFIDPMTCGVSLPQENIAALPAAGNERLAGVDRYRGAANVRAAARYSLNQPL
jgi:hypothetical protein